jgi:glycosyltransferase involved in cell wall biosynthesis
MHRERRRDHAGLMRAEPRASDTQDARRTVVIVDWNVTSTSPIGSSILELATNLAERYRLVVVAAYFDNPNPGRVEHVKVWLPPLPSFAKELCWPSIVRIAFLTRLRRLPYHVTRATQGQLPGADISSAHFCHRAYLDSYFPRSGTRGLRRISRYLVHRHGARLERKAFRRARVITVPSTGLRREIEGQYPFASEKLVCIPNPVDTARYAPDDAFDREAARAELALESEDTVFAFVALGDFARKGLAIAIGALARLQAGRGRILVVGGTEGEIAKYRRFAGEVGVEDAVLFVGLKTDIRPYLWLSDAFLFPTIYEAGSKAVLQAAAAGLPVIATRIHGIEDMLEHGVNGWFAERSEEGFAEAMRRAFSDRDALREMGEKARASASAYDRKFFVGRWDDVFAWAHSGAQSAAPPQSRPLPIVSLRSAERDRT